MTLVETLSILCPYCGEEMEIRVDLSVHRQSYVEDCQICCSPISIFAEMDDRSGLKVTVSGMDD